MNAAHVVRRIPKTALVCAAAAILLAGCTTVMDGSVTRDPGFTPGQVTPVLLQTGNYPTAPKSAVKPNADVAVLFEAQRMAGYVIYPWEVDPAITHADQMGTMVIKSPQALGIQIPGTSTADIATANGFINGFTTSRSVPESAPGRHMALNIMVLRFPGPAQANTAAAALTAQQSVPQGSTGAHPMAIPGHPEAPATAVVLDNGRPSVVAISAHGPYVFYLFTQTDDTADSAAAVIGKALDLQGPRIDQFQPTDPAQFPTMNLDPTGLLARSLPLPHATVNNGVYSTAAMLHFSAGDDPTTAIDRFAAAGIDEIVMGKSTLYRTKDAAAATAFAALVAVDFADGADPHPPVPGFPAAKCFTIKKPSDFGDRVRCVATADRYVITVFSKQSLDAVQQISAQYLMLVGK